MDWDADLDKCLKPFAEPLVFQGQTVDAVSGVEIGTLFGDGTSRAIGSKQTVQVRKSAVPGIGRGYQVTFQGGTWNVVDFLSSGDGRALDLFLEKIR